jgi:hypothetical protein
VSNQLYVSIDQRLKTLWVESMSEDTPTTRSSRIPFSYRPPSQTCCAPCTAEPRLALLLLPVLVVNHRMPLTSADATSRAHGRKMPTHCPSPVDSRRLTMLARISARARRLSASRPGRLRQQGARLATDAFSERGVLTGEPRRAVRIIRRPGQPTRLPARRLRRLLTGGRDRWRREPRPQSRRMRAQQSSHS